MGPSNFQSHHILAQYIPFSPNSTKLSNNYKKEYEKPVMMSPSFNPHLMHSISYWVIKIKICKL